MQCSESSKIDHGASQRPEASSMHSECPGRRMLWKEHGCWPVTHERRYAIRGLSLRVRGAARTILSHGWCCYSLSSVGLRASLPTDSPSGITATPACCQCHAQALATETPKPGTTRVKMKRSCTSEGSAASFLTLEQAGRMPFLGRQVLWAWELRQGGHSPTGSSGRLLPVSNPASSPR